MYRLPNRRSARRRKVHRGSRILPGFDGTAGSIVTREPSNWSRRQKAKPSNKMPLLPDCHVQRYFAPGDTNVFTGPYRRNFRQHPQVLSGPDLSTVRHWHSFGPIRSALRPPTAIASHQARRRRAGYSLARSGGASLPPAYGCESRASTCAGRLPRAPD
jgi:hypothetical protein